jgi:thimet oligopeptidase
MSPRRKERRVVAVAGAAALVAVGLNLAFSAVAAHRRRKRQGKRRQTLSRILDTGRLA